MYQLLRTTRTFRQRIAALTAEPTLSGRSGVPSEDGLRSDRGDVPGWVLVTLMTAGLVTLLWQTAGPLLTSMFTTAMNSVSGG